MFESIQGRLTRREPASAVVEAGGLGYLLHVPLSTYEALPPVESDVRLLLHLAVRGDEWRMFGFATEEERAVFRALVRVSGIGPVLALSLLSGFRASELRTAVAQSDIRSLTRVKGVGRKTAERIVVELRDVWQDGAEDAGALPPLGEEPGPLRDAVRALESLGMDAGEARRRVQRHAADAAEPDVADLVRRALKG